MHRDCNIPIGWLSPFPSEIFPSSSREPGRFIAPSPFGSVANSVWVLGLCFNTTCAQLRPFCSGTGLSVRLTLLKSGWGVGQRFLLLSAPLFRLKVLLFLHMNQVLGGRIVPGLKNPPQIPPPASSRCFSSNCPL